MCNCLSSPVCLSICTLLFQKTVYFSYCLLSPHLNSFLTRQARTGDLASVVWWLGFNVLTYHPQAGFVSWSGNQDSASSYCLLLLIASCLLSLCVSKISMCFMPQVRDSDSLPHCRNAGSKSLSQSMVKEPVCTGQPMATGLAVRTSNNRASG